MNLDLSQDQEMMRETFARFLNENSSPARVRAALPGGFDRALWAGLAELGAFSLRVPQSHGGLGLSLLDAAVLMEEAGRTLVSGPLAETLVVARLLAMLGGGASGALLERVLAGKAVVGIAFADIAREPVQWVAGGAVAEAVIARKADQIVLIADPGGSAQERAEPRFHADRAAASGRRASQHAVERSRRARGFRAGPRGVEAAHGRGAGGPGARGYPAGRSVCPGARRLRAAHRNLSGHLASAGRSHLRCGRRQISHLEGDPRHRRPRVPRGRGNLADGLVERR